MSKVDDGEARRLIVTARREIGINSHLAHCPVPSCSVSQTIRCFDLDGHFMPFYGTSNLSE